MTTLIVPEDGVEMLPVFPVSISKVGSNNGGGNYAATMNNVIVTDFPDNIMANLDSTLLEANLLVTCVDTTNANAVVNNVPYTFYDQISDRYVGQDVLIRSATFTSQGGARTLDVSGMHNLRRESMNCFEDSWTSKNAKSLMGTALASSADNGQPVSTLMTGTASLIQYPLNEMFGFCKGRENFYTKENGKCTVTVNLDPTKGGAFKALNPIYQLVSGPAYSCSSATLVNNTDIDTVVLTNSPLVAPIVGQTFVISYEDTSPSLVGKTTRFKTGLGFVTGWTANTNTLDISCENAIIDNDAVPINISVQLLNVPITGAQTRNMFAFADKTLSNIGQATTLTTVKNDWANTGAVQLVLNAGQKYLVIYASALTGQIKYKYLVLTGADLTTANTAGTATVTFAATTLGANAETIVNPIFIPITYNPDTLVFSYQITDWNMVLYQNVFKPEKQMKQYMSWVYDPITFQSQSEQSFTVLIRPNALMLMVLTPLNGSVVSTRDTCTQIQMYLDDVPTTNIPLTLGTDEYNAIVMVQNYGSGSPYVELESLVPDLSVSNTSATVIPLMIAQLTEGAQRFQITFTSSGVLTQKNGYIFQLVQQTL